MRPQRRATGDYVKADSHRRSTVHRQSSRDGKSTAEILAERDTAELRKLKSVINAMSIETWADRTPTHKDDKYEAIRQLFDKPAKRNWQVDFRKIKGRWVYGGKADEGYIASSASLSPLLTTKHWRAKSTPISYASLIRGQAQR